MTPVIETLPYPHLVLDRFVSDEQLRYASYYWPDKGWSGWVLYNGPQEGKKASDLSASIPEVYSCMIAEMALLPIGDWLGEPDTVADLSLHGGGLHEMPCGCRLGLHEDADTHPRLGLARVWSAVVYVHPWECHGGDLLFTSPGGDVLKRIAPVPGRLVAFDSRGTRHAVAAVEGNSPSRRSLALFGYSASPGSRNRLRSHFPTFSSGGV